MTSRVVLSLILCIFMLLPAGMLPETGRSGQIDSRLHSTLDQLLAVVVESVGDWFADFRAKLNSQPIRPPAAAALTATRRRGCRATD